MSARDDIFAGIRRSLGVNGKEAPRRAAVEERLRATPRGLVPARGQLMGDALVAMFREQAEAVQASVTEIASAAEIPAEVARYLRQHNLPASLRTGTDPRLDGLDWSSTAIALTRGASAGDDLNGLSHAFGGVAETGTLALVSGPENPTTLNFLPDNHIVVLHAGDLDGDYESLWERLRGRYGTGLMPRTVNMITGPSRSGDIEQQIILGAHGPRRLHIVIIGG